MYWKIAAVVLTILVIVGSLSYIAYSYYYTQASKPFEGLVGFSHPGPIPEFTPETPTSTVEYTDRSGSVSVIEITSTSVTVKTNDNGGTATYAITPATEVHSLVGVGQVGKGLSDIKPGTMVKLATLANDPHTLFWIAFARDPSLEPTQAELKHMVVGVVQGVSKNSITIKPATSTPITLAINDQTHVLYNLMAGETAQAVQAGTYTAIATWEVYSSVDVPLARVIVLNPIRKNTAR